VLGYFCPLPLDVWLKGIPLVPRVWAWANDPVDPNLGLPSLATHQDAT
jgi:hypothetical protein